MGWFGGWVLTFIAGIVNAIGFLGFTHQAITHLTGTATLSAIALAQGQIITLVHLANLLASFLAALTPVSKSPLYGSDVAEKNSLIIPSPRFASTGADDLLRDEAEIFEKPPLEPVFISLLG